MRSGESDRARGGLSDRRLLIRNAWSPLSETEKKDNGLEKKDKESRKKDAENDPPTSKQKKDVQPAAV